MDVQKNWATVKRGEVFRKLTTRPENWFYLGHCKYSHGACQLCGTEIVWQYALVERDPNGVVGTRLLWVGSECIKWYYEAYMPNGLEMALELLRKSTRNIKGGLIAEKLEKFKALYPDIYDYLLGATRRGYRDQTIICLVGTEDKRVCVSRFRASLRRKGYLRLDEMQSLCSGHNVWGKSWLDATNSKINEMEEING